MSTALTSDTWAPSTVGRAYADAFTAAVMAPGGGTVTANVVVEDWNESCLASAAAGSATFQLTVN